MKYISKIYAAVFLAVICVICVTAIVPKIPGMIKILNPENNTRWDGAAQYPFKENLSNGIASEEQGAANVITKMKKVGDSAASLKDKIVSLEDMIEDAVTVSYPLRMPFVLMNKAWDKYVCGMNMATSLSGTQATNETVLLQEDGMLAYFLPDFDYAEHLQLLSDFSAEITAQGRNFLFFETLYKSEEFDSQYLGVYQSILKENQPQIYKFLSDHGVNFVSCSEQMNKEGLEPSKLFFKTDHHWLPQTGLWACGLLSDALNDTAGYQIDSNIFDENNYDISILPDFFLGSQGKKVTEIYTDIEDFPILYPKYDSDLTVFHSSLNDTLTGTIADTMFDKELLNISGIYECNTYNFYSYGDEALVQIHNNNLSDGHRVLFIKESFADCMAPYLSNIAEYVDFVDLRHFNGSLQTYIEQTNPDTVVVIYSARGFIHEDVFDFG